MERYFDDKRIEEETIPKEQWCTCWYCREMEEERENYEIRNRYVNEDGFRMYKYRKSEGQEVIVPVSEWCTVKRRPYILTSDLPGNTQPQKKP